MSRSPGEAYANLVGVAPANFAANTAGKLRVDPGNPANGRRLPSAAIQLIEEWIADGAPETGFVAPSGCQGS